MGGRLQFRPLHGGAWLIDDTYNANPSSAQPALEVLAELPGRRWLVLGDMAELGELRRGQSSRDRRAGAPPECERLFAIGPLGQLAAELRGRRPIASPT